MSKSSTYDERVRTRAYHLWEKAGRPQGRDSEFWHQAMELEQGPGKEASTGASPAAHSAPAQPKVAAKGAKASAKAGPKTADVVPAKPAERTKAAKARTKT